MEERRCIKLKIGTTRSERVKDRLRTQYSEKDKDVKKSMRRDKRQWFDNMASEAETAANNGNMRKVYETTRQMCNEGARKAGLVKSKDGEILTKDTDIMERWKEHFIEVLNRTDPVTPADIDVSAVEEYGINTDPPTADEVRLVLRKMKAGKAPVWTTSLWNC